MRTREEHSHQRPGTPTPEASPHLNTTPTYDHSLRDSTSSVSSILSAGSASFTIGGATVSSGSDGSTRYILRDSAPIHNNRLNVMSRSHNERLHHALRTPTPEASRYEPNFMLSSQLSEYPKYDSCYTMRSASPRTSRKSESRYMVRPKIRTGTKQFDPRLILQPPTPELPRSYGSKHSDGLGKERKEVEPGTLYDSYWHIPRASLWCSHKGCVYDSQPCKECQWKQEECSSTCSSINPPPTFTALDNYRPVRPRPKCHQCSCGIIFAITTVFSLLVLLLITGFILYIEMVLKHQTATVTDRM